MKYNEEEPHQTCTFSPHFLLSLFVGHVRGPVKIGVVLDLGTEVAQIWLSCINIALSDFYASHASYKTRLDLRTRDSKEDVVSAAAAGSFCFLL